MSATVATIVRPEIPNRRGAFSRLVSACWDAIARSFVRRAAIASLRELDDRALRVLELSRSCHLRWSQPELVAPPPRTGAGRPTLFVGPTCYEDDALGEWTVEPARFPAGSRAVLRNITGYAVAWNVAFGGIGPADVVLVG